MRAGSFLLWIEIYSKQRGVEKEKMRLLQALEEAAELHSVFAEISELPGRLHRKKCRVFVVPNTTPFRQNIRCSLSDL